MTSGNPYPNGILYTTPAITIQIQDGVVVNSTLQDGIGIEASGNLNLNTNGAVSVTASGANRDGIRVDSIASGNVVIDSTANITTTVANGDGVIGRSNIGSPSGSSQGSGSGTVAITSSGDLTIQGNNAAGIAASAAGPSINVNVSGDISTFGATGSPAILAQNQGAGSVNITVNGANLSTAGSASPGIEAVTSTGPAIVQATGTITTTGSDSSHGISATSSLVGGTALTVDWNGAITTRGDSSAAILARTIFNGAGGISIVSAGPITTTGASSSGIDANSAGGGVSVTNNGTIVTAGSISHGIAAGGSGPVTVTTANVTTAGNFAHGIRAGSGGSGSNGAVSVNSTAGTIHTAGFDANGIFASSVGGPVTVTAADIATSGGSGIGITARSDGNGAVTIDATAGTIQTTGSGAGGIVASSSGGPITVTTANITTGDDVARGVTATTLGTGANGAVTIDTTAGAIQTMGETALGISVFSLGGPVTVTTASITTGSVGSGSHGINAESSGVGASGAVTIDSSAGTIQTMSNDSRGISAASAGGPVTVTVGNITTAGDNSQGIVAESDGTGSNGAVTVNSTAGTIRTAGRSEGIAAFSTGGPVTVTSGDVITTGDVAAAINAGINGTGANGAVTIDTMAGAIRTTGHGARGVSASSLGGPIMVTTGNVTTSGDLSIGVTGENSGTGSNGAVTIDTTAGTIQTVGDSAPGIYTFSAGGPVAVTTGSITTGSAGSGSYGIRAQSGGVGANGAVTINSTAGTIQTMSNGSRGILAVSAGGPVTVISSSISTTGDFLAAGIEATSNGIGADGTVAVNSTAGMIHTTGDSSRGISAASAGGPVTVTAGNVTTTGQSAFGINAASQGVGVNGAVTVNLNGTTSATGRLSAGALAFAPSGTVDVAVASGVNVTGGWQGNPNDLGPSSTPSGGLIVGGNAAARPLAAHVANNGTIGALSDRAIATADVYGVSPSGGGIQVDNNGTVAGYVTFGSGANIFNNFSPNSFDLRNFTDTNGDGVRDTKGVAISNFGGPGATFNNDVNGVLRLSTVNGATNTNAAGSYIPAGLNPVSHDITQTGIEQGHLVNLSSFINSGVITMQDVETGGSGPVAGDVLVITGGSVAGTPGGGIFRSNGGRLHLDTVLNEGGASSRSDVLVVDGTAVASSATRVRIANADGGGALTFGDGIKVVDVLTSSASAAGAFVLGNRVAAGAHEYQLFRGGVADPADGDWYLRSNLIVNSGGVPTTIPNYRVEVPLYSAVPSLAFGYGYTMLDTLHERVGEEEQLRGRGDLNARRTVNGAWGRVIGEAGRRDPNNFSKKGPDFDYTVGAIQTGLDLYRTEKKDGPRNHAGLYLGVGRIESDVDHVNGGKAGEVNINAYTLGAYWTHFGANGWYLDPVLQVTRYNVHAHSKEDVSAKTDGWGLAASLEGGYPIAFGSRWTVEPQAQVLYQRILVDSARDTFGQIDFKDSDGLRGRLGFRLAKTWNAGSGSETPEKQSNSEPAEKDRLITGWLRANVWHEFDSTSKTTVASLDGLNGTSFRSTLRGTWAEVGAGITGQITRVLSVYASGEYQAGFDGRRHGFGGKLGLRVNW